MRVSFHPIRTRYICIEEQKELGGESGLNLTERKKREEVCVWYLAEKDNSLSHGRKEAHVAPLTDKVTQNCWAGSRGGLERQASISASQGSGL